jgi:AraC-like DNA-binding protein
MRYIDLLSLKSADSQNLCRSQILVSLLRALLLEMLAQVENMRRTTSIDVKQKGVILDQFIAAVKATPRCREVAYFAERLSISPKQLSAIVGDGTGFSAKEFIDRNAIDVIKHLLRTTDLSVKDIAEQLNYTGSGNLCRFFKTRTGLTISEYKQH